MPIATRTLIAGVGKEEAEVAIHISAPVEQAPREWTCEFEIGWPNQTMAKRATGVDSMQALVLALQMIGSVIYASEYHKRGELRWARHGEGYGFPVAGSLRDLLQGSDLRFF